MHRLAAMLRILFALMRVLQPDLTRLRVPNGRDKRRLLRAIDRSRGVLGLRRVLTAVGLSPSRLGVWQRATKGCELEDQSSCPALSPQGLTPQEVSSIQGRIVDFHSLRVTFITRLSQAGVHPRTAQALARHSKLELTMQTYTDVRLLDLRSALGSTDHDANSSSRRKKKVVG